jgi:hypothetical protein
LGIVLLDSAKSRQITLSFSKFIRKKMGALSRVLGLIIPLLLIACTEWGPDKKARRAMTLYADVALTLQGTIPRGAICQIEQRLSMGEIYGFHKVDCQNGQSGYIKIGDAMGGFESVP